MKFIFDLIFSSYLLIEITFQSVFARNSESQSGHLSRDVLILASDFLPKINGGTYRPLSWLRNSTEFGLNVSVVTSEGFSTEVSDSLQIQIPKNVRQFYVSKMTYIQRFGRLFTDRPSFLLTSYVFCKRHFDKSHPDSIVATGPGFSSFIVACALANIFRTKLVLDYRDEWTDNPFEFVLHSRFDVFFERICLKRANLVIFTTESQKQNCIQKYGDLSLLDKSTVIPNGYDLPDKSREYYLAAEHERLVISFSGALANHTNPDLFFNFLSTVIDSSPELEHKLTIQFVGSKSLDIQNNINQFAYSKCISCIEQKNHSELSLILYQSDFLLLIVDARFKKYVPGKLYDYISMEKPILVIGVGACGPEYEMYNLLNSYSEVYYIENSLSLKEAIKFRTKKPPAVDSLTVYKESYCRDSLAKRFWQSILKL